MAAEKREKTERMRFFWGIGGKEEEEEEEGGEGEQHLDFEEVGAFVLAFGHVDIDELKVDIFLDEAGQDARDGCGHGRPVHLHCRHFSLSLSASEAQRRKDGNGGSGRVIRKGWWNLEN